MSRQPKHPLKRFCIRKFVLAHSAAHALRIEKTFDADEVFLDLDDSPQVKGFEH